MRAFLFLLGSLFITSICLGQAEQCPCCTEQHAAFDFWVGTWEVTLPNGNIAGFNTIEKQQDGCMLQENWSGANGQYTGTSLNFYNRNTTQWEQLWIDNSGNPLKLKGNRVNNQMILSSDPFTQADGELYINRITWTLNEDGTVRQLWEVLKDGTAVNVLFDGLYTKKM